MKKLLLFSLLVFSAAAHAQDSPKFWTKQRIAATSLNFFARSYDAAQTCHGLMYSKGFHENVFPTQSCAGVAMFSAGFAGSALLSERLLYKRHPRLAHIPQWASFASASMGIIGTHLEVRFKW
jgi:hypothetical protein